MQRILDRALPVVFAVGLICVVLANPDPLARDTLCNLINLCVRSLHAEFWNNLLYEIGLGAAISIAFYWLLVKIPEHAKRARLRKHLLASYRSFRKDATFQFLSASGEQSIRLDRLSELETQSAFREYFQTPSVKLHGDRWHDVANGLEEHHRRELFLITSMLRDDVVYVLNNTEIDDQQSFDFLHRLTKAIASHDPRNADYDEDKALLRFFWTLMAGWHPVKGYEEEDPIERLMRRI